MLYWMKQQESLLFSIENRNLPVHQVELSITVLPGEDFIWSLASQQSLIKV